jgi:hypothetical protein
LDPVRLNAGGQLNRASIELQEPQVLQEPPNALDMRCIKHDDLRPLLKCITTSIEC